MSLPNAQHEYTRRLGLWDAEIARLDRTSGHISTLRLIVAGIALVVAIEVVRGVVSSWSLALPGLAFLALVVIHARVIESIARARRARGWYEHGLDRVNGTWPGRGPDGRRFLENRPFAADLDLFGTGSLFQLLNTARTEAGEHTLAVWLSAAAPIDEIRARQAAVDELRPGIEFREGLAVTAVDTQTSRTGGLLQWAAQAAAGLSGGTAVAFAAIGVVSFALLILTFRGTVEGWIFLLWLMVQATVILAYWRKNAAALAGIDDAVRELALLAAILARVEGQDFQCERLRRLRESLLTGTTTPSRRIAELVRLINWLDSTRNQIAAPFAWLLMVPFQLGVAIDRWHARYGHAIAEWVQAVADLEALSAFATYSYEHPADPFPAIDTDGPRFEASALGHPLISEAVAIRNDVALGGDHPHLLLVSGSNMSGKSTLLRAIGVNVVLGLAGAPVRAASLRLSPMTLGTSLRIEDSLQAGHSRFYAEILRIRAIVDLTRPTAQGSAVMFLLDEMLAGTNSHDRRIGAEAIIRTLISHGAIGLVTTHDLALADVVPSMGPLAANVHFEDRIEDGAMVFDYRMRPGVVTHSNALALMRAIGLNV